MGWYWDDDSNCWIVLESLRDGSRHQIRYNMVQWSTIGTCVTASDRGFRMWRSLRSSPCDQILSMLFGLWETFQIFPILSTSNKILGRGHSAMVDVYIKKHLKKTCPTSSWNRPREAHWSRQDSGSFAARWWLLDRGYRDGWETVRRCDKMPIKSMVIMVIR